MILFTLTVMLPLWRLKEEEGPHLSYSLPREKITTLIPTQARVIKIGMGVALGSRFGHRKIYWGIDGSTTTGSTPYLPFFVTMNINKDTKVWVGVDPMGKTQPLFLGFEK